MAQERNIGARSFLVTKKLQHSWHFFLTIWSLEGSKHKATGLSPLPWPTPEPGAQEDQEEQLQLGMWGFVGEVRQRAGSQGVCAGGDGTLLSFIRSKYCLCVAFCLLSTGWHHEVNR